MKGSFTVSRRHNISFYDSSYIAMSKLLDIPLWTLDKLQGRIAVKVGATLWEE
jgi:predicted nucleic acid-binding protein